MKKILTGLCALVAMGVSAQQKAASWTDNVKVSGFVISQYQYSAQSNAEQNTFNIRMARLSLDGKIGEDFYWKTQMQVSGNTSTLGSSPRVVDFFVDWRKYKEFNVRVGEFQVPFTMESPIHPIDVGFMDNGQAVLKMTGYADRSGMHSSNGRDVGVMVQGDLFPNSNGRSILHYALSAVNGQGINLKDVDQTKTLVGSLWFAPVKGLRIGVSGWEGAYARKGSWIEDGVTKSGVRSLDQHRYAISADYQSNGWTLRSEYIHSTGEAFAKKMEDTSENDCTVNEGIGNKADGYYALVIAPVYKDKVTVKVRYDVYRNTAEWSSAKSFYEVGADYHFSKKVCFSAEYAFVNDRTSATDQNYNILNAELSVKF